MKKARKSKVGSLTLDYSLSDLPTAQHKAGLAGLILHVRNLKERKVAKPIPELVELTSMRAILRLTKPQLQTLFDDLYDARWVEDEVRVKYHNKDPKRVKEVRIEENGKIKKEKRFVYDRCEPLGHVLCFYQSGTDNPWVKLWREMLWSVLRAQPKTRVDYETRADGKAVALARKFWEALVKVEQGRTKGKFVTETIAGSVFVGAQADNAERVPFLGRIEHNLLLHFWQWVTPIYVPRVVNNKDEWPKPRGYLLAVPEVSDLKFFSELIQEFWQGLDRHVTGYRPTQALIDLPEEGGLEFLYHLARRKVKALDISSVLHAVELYHLEKQGNNVRMLVAERLLPDPYVLGEYQRIHGKALNPQFKSLRIRNLLTGKRWHEGAEGVFAAQPFANFIHTAETPKYRFFGADAKVYFSAIIQDLERKESHMTQSTPETRDDALARRVYRLIGDYVLHKTKDKTGKDKSSFPKNEKGYPVYSPGYLEAREKVSKDAFLAMRSRRDEDFVEYFTGSICSVSHFLPEEEYLAVSQALVEKPGMVKNLAMLALSAHSWTPDPKTNSSTKEE